MHLRPPTPLTLHDNSSDPITLGFVAYRVPGYEDKDFFASQILNDVLNSQRGALYELQASGKALGTFAQSVTYPKAGMTLVGSAVPVTTTGEQAISDVKAVIEAYKKSGLPPELVAVAKQREVSQAQFARNSINGLATLWSQTLAVEQRTPDEELAGLQGEGLAVSSNAYLVHVSEEKSFPGPRPHRAIRCQAMLALKLLYEFGWRGTVIRWGRRG